MSHSNPIALILSLSLASVPLASAQFEYTGGGDVNWFTFANWKTPGSNPATNFPNELGAVVGPGTTVLFPNTAGSSSLRLGSETRLEDLTIENNGTFDLDLNGKFVTIRDVLSVNANGLTTFLNSTAETSIMEVFEFNGGAQLNDVSMQVTTAFIDTGINLAGSASYVNRTLFDLTSDAGVGVSPGATGVFQNQGNVVKTGGTGQSNFQADYQALTSTVVSALSGTLAFTGDFIAPDSVIAANINSRVTFAGATTIGTTFLNLEGSGEIEFLSPLTFVGTLKSSSGFPLVVTGDVRIKDGFTGDIIDFIEEVPFVMAGGSQNPNRSVTNVGFLEWQHGTLGPLVNQPSGEMRTANSGGFGVRRAIQDSLVNQGLLSGSFILEASSLLTNDPSGTLELASVSAEGTGVQKGRIVNTGLVSYALVGASSLTAPIESSGTIKVENGTLSISEAELSGVLQSLPPASGTTCLLEFRSVNGSSIEFGDTAFEAINGGQFRFGGGTYLLDGDLSSSSGQDADGTVGMALGKLQVSGPSSLNFSSQIPLEFGQNSSTYVIDVAAPLSNLGGFQVNDRVRVQGSETFSNSGVIDIHDSLDIGDRGTPNTGPRIIDGNFVNSGTVNLHGPSARLRLNYGGGFLNADGGVISMENAVEISSRFTSESLLNSGIIRSGNSNGNLQEISANLIQSGANARLEAIAGGNNLVLDGDNQFQGGVISSEGLVRFFASNEFSGASLEVLNGGRILILGDAVISAPLTGSGNGTIESEADIQFVGNHVMDFLPTAPFEIQGGFVSGDDAENQGHLELSSQAIFAANLVNTGTLKMNGNSRFSGENLVNTGILELAGGIISNPEPATQTRAEILPTSLLNQGTINILGSTALGANGTLTNQSIVEQMASLNFREGAQVLAASGQWNIYDSSDMSKTTGGGTRSFTLSGSGSLTKNLTASGSPTDISSVSIDRFEMTGGTLSCVAGELEFSANVLAMSGGTLSVAKDATLDLRAFSLEGNEVDALHSEGTTQLKEALTVTGPISGNGLVQGDLDQQGLIAPALNFTQSQLAEATDFDLSISGDLIQSPSAATLIHFTLATNTQILVSDDCSLGGTLNLEFADDATLSIGDTRTIITAGDVTNTFSEVNIINPPLAGLAAQLTYNPQSVDITFVSAGTDFATWAASVFTPAQLADPLISGPNANPDNDDLANIFEFIFGTSPLSGNDVFPVVFSVASDSQSPPHYTPIFDVTVEPGRIGYTLSILGLNDLSTNSDDEILNSTAQELPSSILRVMSVQPVSGPAQFFALGASLNP